MKTEKRKARAGEMILIVNPQVTAGLYEKGSVLKVRSRGYEDLGVDAFLPGRVFFIRDGEYEVISEDGNSIKEELERARTEMHELAADFGLIHEKVIAASQRLDGLLNRYDAMRKNE